jgi:F-type H+-transporting ATPase subunit a
MTIRVTTMACRLALAATLLTGLTPALRAQAEHTPPAERTAREATAPATQHEATRGQIDLMQHIGNSREIEIPFLGVRQLPTGWVIPGTHIDMSLTKHTVFLLLAAALVATIFLVSAAGVRRAQAQGRPARGFAGAMEAMALYIRQEVILPNVGHHGEGFAPYLLTLFFFILACNLLGLLPWGATATGNIAVTAALALIAFLVIEISGFVTLGPIGYLKTIVYIPPGLPGGFGGLILKIVLAVIMTPIEIIGKLAKPFALALRLFANMTAGHVLVLALIGLTFLFHSYFVGIGASILATGIMVLEVFVAFLQAFVFTLLTSVFIGLMRAEH